MCKALGMYNSCNPQRDHSGREGYFTPNIHSEEAAAQRLSGLPEVTQLERQSQTQPRQTAPEAMPSPSSRAILGQGREASDQSSVPRRGWVLRPPHPVRNNAAAAAPTGACYHADACRVPGPLQAPFLWQLRSPSGRKLELREVTMGISGGEEAASYYTNFFT